MRKISKAFVFHYPLKRKAVRDLKIVTEHVGELVVEGVGYFDPSANVLDIFERYSVDIDFVRWQGTDIKAVLEVTGVLEDVEEATIRFFAAQHQGKHRSAA